MKAWRRIIRVVGFLAMHSFIFPDAFWVGLDIDESSKSEAENPKEEQDEKRSA